MVSHRFSQKESNSLNWVPQNCWCPGARRQGSRRGSIETGGRGSIESSRSGSRERGRRGSMEKQNRRMASLRFWWFFTRLGEWKITSFCTTKHPLITKLITTVWWLFRVCVRFCTTVCCCRIFTAVIDTMGWKKAAKVTTSHNSWQALSTRRFLGWWPLWRCLSPRIIFVFLARSWGVNMMSIPRVQDLPSGND